MVVAIVLLAISVILLVASVIGLLWYVQQIIADNQARAESQLVRHLAFQSEQANDIRALTHSLCREHSITYIPPIARGPLQPSGGGWFDKKRPPVVANGDTMVGKVGR